MCNAKVSPVAEGCPLKRAYKRGGCYDGRTEGNPISPFRNFVATGDKKVFQKWIPPLVIKMYIYVYSFPEHKKIRVYEHYNIMAKHAGNNCYQHMADEWGLGMNGDQICPFICTWMNILILYIHSHSSAHG